MNPDDIRRYLYGLIHARSLTLSEVSKAIGRNHAYLQQYMQRGSPRILPEEVRIKLGEYLGVDAQNFSPLRDTTTRLNQREVSVNNRKDHRIGNLSDSARDDRDETLSEMDQRIAQKIGFFTGILGKLHCYRDIAIALAASYVIALFRQIFCQIQVMLTTRIIAKNRILTRINQQNRHITPRNNIIEIDG